MTAAQAPAPTGGAPRALARPHHRRAGKDLTGTAFLLGFGLRRERLRIAAWLVGITALVLVTTQSIRDLYPTQADLDQAALAAQGNAGAIAFNGPVQGLTTVGGEVAFQSGSFVLVLVALMTLLMVTRCTRAEEESGRTELLRATPLGRNAQTAAALLLVTGMNVVLALVVTVGLVAQGLPVVGTLSFGASSLAVGVVFAAVSLVTAQLVENGRTASGLAGIVLGYAFVLRAIGDIHDARLSWLSPIGWSQKARPFAGERWWPFVVPAGVTVALLLVAHALAGRRDWGAGLAPARPGPGRAAPGLGRPLGLALRLDRATVLGWSGALVVLGVAYGSIAEDVDSFVKDNQTLRDLFAGAGGPSLIDSYFATATMVLALVACCCPVQILQHARAEETSQHAELVLATPTGRVHWLAAQLLVAWAGSLVVLVAGGLGAGVPYALETGHWARVPTLVGAALAYLPALWLVAAVAVGLFGLVPGALGIVWVGVVGCFVVGFLGPVLKLPHWVRQLSPFEQAPHLPAAQVSITPLVVQGATALVLVAWGLLAFRSRDVG